MSDQIWIKIRQFCDRKQPKARLRQKVVKNWTISEQKVDKFWTEDKMWTETG